MTIDRAALAKLIHQYGLDDYAETILANARPGIHIKRTRVADESEIPIGTSKLGGSPDLPAGFEWKTWHGYPLTFIAQFKLSEVEPYDVDKLLPPEGMLYFFYEAWGTPVSDDHEWWNKGGYVHYHPDERTSLIRTLHPVCTDLNPVREYYAEHGWEGYGTSMFRDDATQVEALKPCRVEFVSTLMPLHHFRGAPIPYSSTEEREWSRKYHDLKSHVGKHVDPAHQLLGVSYAVQDQVEWHCDRWNIPDCRLLLQIDTDDYNDNPGIGTCWGDAGMLYCIIAEADLHTKRFDRCFFHMDSY